METRDEATMETNLQKLGAKIDELVRKADAAGDHGVRELKAKHVAVRAKLDALNMARGRDWETMKKDVEAAWKELEAAFHRMESR